jgi:hypothetical protein
MALRTLRNAQGRFSKSNASPLKNVRARKSMARSRQINRRMPSLRTGSATGMSRTGASRTLRNVGKPIAGKVAQSLPSRAPKGAMNWLTKNKGRNALIGTAIAGAGAFAAYRSTQRSARDLNQTLGNPASNVTAWTTYNRTNRGY